MEYEDLEMKNTAIMEAMKSKTHQCDVAENEMQQAIQQKVIFLVGPNTSGIFSTRCTSTSSTNTAH